MANYNYINIKYSIIPLVLCMGIAITDAHSQDLIEIQIANEYWIKGEKEKALSAYELLTKKQENIALIHNNYFNLLIDMGKFKEAEDYVEHVIKKNPNQNSYRLDLGVVYVRAGDVQKADRYFKSFIKNS